MKEYPWGDLESYNDSLKLPYRSSLKPATETTALAFAPADVAGHLMCNCNHQVHGSVGETYVMFFSGLTSPVVSFHYQTTAWFATRNRTTASAFSSIQNTMLPDYSEFTA